MKKSEELQEIREELNNLREELRELSEEELNQITGGFLLSSNASLTCTSRGLEDPKK